MKFKASVLLLAAATMGVAYSQTSYTSTSATGAWNASRWNNSSDGPAYTSAFTANNAVNFTSGNYTFAGMGSTTNVGNVTVASGVSVTFTSIGSTYATGGLVRTISVGANGLFDLNGNSVSTAAGTGLIKDGAGVFGTGGGSFTGGFTLNGGTVIARGTTGLGSGASNTLALNSGTIASNNSRDFADTRFGGGITIGGNIQFGELATVVSIANSTANLSFANNVSLGSATRTLTLGNNGTQTFSGVISNTTGGITFAANAGTDGRFDLTNASNTFTGDININGGEVRFTADGSMGNADNDIVIDGGRFAKASDATTVTLGAGRTISIGDGAGTSISSPGTGTLIYNGIIANKTGETGSWAKQGGGTLELGGASSYTGSTAVNNGILKLTTGNNRLPTGTVVSIGQSASGNLGTLDLNGFNQEIAGLNSVTGTNAGVSTNVVTSASGATLTINTPAATTHTYSQGTTANSGVISGAVSLVKSGDGTQILNGVNTYTGSTTVNGGVLEITGSGSINGTSGITINGGTLKYNSSTALTQPMTLSAGTLGGTNWTGAGLNDLTIGANQTISPGNSPGTASTVDQTWASMGSYEWEINSLAGTAGVDPGWDLLSGSGTLDITATSSNPFQILVTSLTLSNLAGSLALFDDTSNYSWMIAEFAAINGFVADKFDIDTASFANSFTGNFGVSLDTSGLTDQLYLNYTAVPEPGAALLGGLGMLALLRRRR